VNVNKLNSAASAKVAIDTGANFAAGHEALFKSAKLDSLAHLGKYEVEMESAA